MKRNNDGSSVMSGTAENVSILFKNVHNYRSTARCINLPLGGRSALYPIIPTRHKLCLYMDIRCPRHGTRALCTNFKNATTNRILDYLEFGNKVRQAHRQKRVTS
ncbi:uncharacterized protein LACBIDRAFT_330221 [Laccaria bicolor S238N-H82]|uniref:Predicted protein n=1 Tax=Laccaria bicolor (strain S238N-H82 / ATCC MYA-4686) TaxID=486041 RepID=B0DJZ2_LACBS|nr:uncharacterized protein LACBIDRAFT_330221 [Laccaria bicolor S238N-H82]EDR05099.1 predicted protein [Laccaria bicolor S238N-H82]|eukprot:XP_001884489.1 predicted protein [Laccaria bicolor S238N-H82]